MAELKNYIAFYDDGHDCGEFTFESTHRVRSKANLKDAIETYKRKFGYKHKIRINWVQRDYNEF